MGIHNVEKKIPREALLYQFQESLTEKLRQGVGIERLFVPVVSGDDIWLFPSRSILKITSSEKITKVPNSFGFVSGVVTFDGTIHTLLDFNKVVIGGSEVVKSVKSRVIYLQNIFEDMPIALLVERVLDLIAMPENDVTITSGMNVYSDGSVNILGDEDTYQLVNVESLFSPKFID